MYFIYYSQYLSWYFIPEVKVSIAIGHQLMVFLFFS